LPHETKALLDDIEAGMDHLMTTAAFVLLGLMLPWREWVAMGWRALAVVVAVMCLRRMPWVFLLQRLMRRQVKTHKQALFLGWFGPVGISALFYATEGRHNPWFHDVWPVVVLIVCASTVAHAVTSSIWTRYPLHEQVPRQD
jgi:NhaP-type Na+/H+ or K+/H+ antiporter